MGDDKAGPALHQGAHGGLNMHLGSGIDAAGCLVENQNNGIGKHGASDRQELPLALAQVAAAREEQRIISIGQLHDEVMRIGKLGGSFDLLVRGIQPAVANVLPDRCREYISILKHDPQLTAQTVLVQLADIAAIYGDYAIINLIEAGEEIDNGGFAGACRADEGNGLAWPGGKRNVPQNRDVFLITEGHMVKSYLAIHIVRFFV